MVSPDQLPQDNSDNPQDEAFFAAPGHQPDDPVFEISLSRLTELAFNVNELKDAVRSAIASGVDPETDPNLNFTTGELHAKERLLELALGDIATKQLLQSVENQEQ